MEIIININDDSKAKAFITFIKSLDFVTVKTKKEEQKISSEQKKAINQALEAVKQGNTIPHEQAMKSIKEKHPKYFK